MGKARARAHECALPPTPLEFLSWSQHNFRESHITLLLEAHAPLTSGAAVSLATADTAKGTQRKAWQFLEMKQHGNGNQTTQMHV